MIRVEIDFGVMLYLMLAMLIMVLWIVFEKKNNTAPNMEQKKFLWHCPTCLYDYIDSLAGRVSECPKCQTLHKNRKKV